MVAWSNLIKARSDCARAKADRQHPDHEVKPRTAYPFNRWIQSTLLKRFHSINGVYYGGGIEKGAVFSQLVVR